MRTPLALLVPVCVMWLGAAGAARAQPAATEPPGGWPVVTVHGETWNQQQLLQRNLGGRDDQTTAFPPHRVAGNIYYVGSNSLASYLIATPQGLILINSSYERNVPVIQKSVEALGFTFSDIKILLGSHAHGDHMEGDAAVKALSGAQVVVMADARRAPHAGSGAPSRPRALPCDVPLASHPAMHKMAEKHARLAAGGPNPFVDPAGYVRELDLTEAMF